MVQSKQQELSNLFRSKGGVHHLAQFFKQAPHHFDSQWSGAAMVFDAVDHFAALHRDHGRAGLHDRQGR